MLSVFAVHSLSESITTRFCLACYNAHALRKFLQVYTRLLLGLVVHFLQPPLFGSQALTIQPTSAHFLLISDVTPWVALGVVYILHPRPCSIFTRGLIELPQLLSACCFNSFVSSGALLYKRKAHAQKNKQKQESMLFAALLQPNCRIDNVSKRWSTKILLRIVKCFPHFNKTKIYVCNLYTLVRAEFRS